MGISLDEKEIVFARNGWQCVKCGSKDNLTVDHIIPKSLGGSDHTGNLRTLCARCNQSRGNSHETVSGRKADLLKMVSTANQTRNKRSKAYRKTRRHPFIKNRG